MRVLVLDDHPLARAGVTDLLTREGVGVVATAGTPGDLRVGAGGPAADVAVCDLYLTGDRPALDTVAELARHLPVLVVSASARAADVLAAVRSGAGGYVTKGADGPELAAAVRRVATGEFHLSTTLADLLRAATRSRAGTDPAPPLSPRESEALGLLARGFTHQQAATRMGVSKATLDTYVARIRGKLRVGNKAELTLAAIDHLASR